MNLLFLVCLLVFNGFTQSNVFSETSMAFDSVEIDDRDLNQTIQKLVEEYSKHAPINRYGDCKDHWGRPIGFYGRQSCLLAEFSDTVGIGRSWNSRNQMYLNLDSLNLGQLLGPLLNDTGVMEKFKNVADECLDYDSWEKPLYMSCVNYQNGQFFYASINCCPTKNCYKLPQTSTDALEHGQRLGGTHLNCTAQWCCSEPNKGDSVTFPMARPKSYSLYWDKETDLINFSLDSLDDERQICKITPHLTEGKYIPTIECRTGGHPKDNLYGVEALMALYSQERLSYDDSHCYMGQNGANGNSSCAFGVEVKTLKPVRITSVQNRTGKLFNDVDCVIRYINSMPYLYCECEGSSDCDEDFYSDENFLQLGILEQENTRIVSSCNDPNERKLPIFLLCRLTVHLEESKRSEVIGLDVKSIRDRPELSEIYCYCVPEEYERLGNSSAPTSCTETQCNEGDLRKHLHELRNQLKRVVDVEQIEHTVRKCFRHRSEATLPRVLDAATVKYDILCYFWYRTGHDLVFDFLLKETINTVKLPMVAALCRSPELTSGSGCVCAEVAEKENEKEGACCCYPDANKQQLDLYANVFKAIEGSLAVD